MFVHGAPLPALTGLAGHHVNIEPLRPVCAFHAAFSKTRNAAVFMPVAIVPPGGWLRTVAGPATRKLVAICSTGSAYFTSIART
jgi:hypothetical protein